MISIVIYGRNDNYGYNQSKRWTLGLNCMAEVLSEPDDEIVYVDYNTPDDFPTFPEAIGDTLTEKAKQLLRVFRVRPEHHLGFAKRTHLSVLEPVARNVAIRRTNPANRWILSTNPDMIFVPRVGDSLSEIAADLPRAYYAIPRFEVPELLWESFDRYDPGAVLQEIARWGEDAYLNDVVYGDDAILYGAPGDFQLVERSDLFAIDGFDESKLLGWHNDSNLFHRLSLHFDGAATTDLADRVLGYHCAHTLQLTPMQAPNAPKNDYETTRWATRAALPEQRMTWGLADVKLEEISLLHTPTQVYLDAMKAALCNEGVGEFAHPRGRIDYDERHVLPFVLNVFVNAPRSLSVAWVGTEPEMFRLFERGWRAMGFGASILIPEEFAAALGDELPPGVQVEDLLTTCMRADAMLFDFAQRNDLAYVEMQARDQRLLHALDAFCVIERLRLQQGNVLQRRILAINAIYNAFDALLLERAECVVTPYCSRIRTGFVPRPVVAEERTVGNDVLVIVPTRSDPAGSAAFAEAFFANSTRSDLLFALDVDDPSLTDYAGISDVQYEIIPRLGRVGTLNLVANKYRDKYAYIACMSDTHRITTPSWDQLLVEAIADLPAGIAYGNDPRGSSPPRAVLMPTSIVDNLGFVAPPALIEHFTEFFWRDLGQALDVLRYRDDVIIENMTSDTGDSDDVTAAEDAEGLDIYASDLATYDHYARTRLGQDVAHLQSMIVANGKVSTAAQLNGEELSSSAVGKADSRMSAVSEIESNPLGALRRKWSEIPVGNIIGRVHTSQMLAMSDEDLLAMWETAWATDTQGMGFGHRGWYQQLYRDLVNGSRLLDVGCGFAIDSLAFAKMGAHVTFADIISDNIEVVRRLCSIQGIDADFLVIEDLGSFGQLPYDFDIVTSLGSLINAPLEFTIAEVTAIKPHLRAGGRWLHFAYPKARWLREGSMPLSRWGENTDGAGTPWMEWHDAAKVHQLFGDSEIRILFECDFHNQDFNWFDIELVRH